MIVYAPSLKISPSEVVKTPLKTNTDKLRNMDALTYLENLLKLIVT